MTCWNGHEHIGSHEMGELKYLPLKERSKEPRDKGFADRDYSLDELDGCNKGLMISTDLVDVDLDWPEAQHIAKHWIEPDTMVWGRKGEWTHLVYRCDLEKSINFELPNVAGAPQMLGAHGRMVLQLRTSAEGEACYAMIPPSVHPDGDELEWVNKIKPTDTTSDDLKTVFGRIAGLSVLARFYPDEGGRDEALMSIAGCAARAGWDQNQIEWLIKQVCNLAGDTSEIDMRLNKAKAALKRLGSGRKVRGIPMTARKLGIPVQWMHKVAVWMGWAYEAPDSSDRAVFLSGVVRDVSQQAWAVLADYEVDGSPGVYQYGEALARVDRGRVQVLNQSTLKTELNRCATWIGYDAKGKPKNTSAPVSCAEDIINARSSEITVPELRKVATVPMFTRDGRLLNEFGFDEDSGMFLYLRDTIEVPKEPTGKQVRDALRTLWRPISDFPFEDRSDRVHALAMMLEPFMRDMLGPTPFYFVSKPAAGTGASLLVETALYPTLGYMPPALTPPRSDEEMQKTLSAALLEGARVIYFDNANAIYAPAIVSALTASTYSARILGASKMLQVPVEVQWVGTGNNTSLSGELYRRVIDIRIDAKVANPEERDAQTFRIPNLKMYVQENSDELVRAACTIIQWWVNKGMPKGRGHRASFEQWASVMSGLFDSINVRGFLDTPTDRKPVDPELDMVKGIVLEIFNVGRGRYVNMDWAARIERPDALKASDMEVMIHNGIIDFDAGKGSVVRQLPRLLGRYKDRVFEFESEKGAQVSLTLKTAMMCNVTRWYVEADREVSIKPLQRDRVADDDLPF